MELKEVIAISISCFALIISLASAYYTERNLKLAESQHENIQNDRQRAISSQLILDVVQNTINFRFQNNNIELESLKLSFPSLLLSHDMGFTKNNLKYDFDDVGNRIRKYHSSYKHYEDSGLVWSFKIPLVVTIIYYIQGERYVEQDAFLVNAASGFDIEEGQNNFNLKPSFGIDYAVKEAGVSMENYRNTFLIDKWKEQLAQLDIMLKSLEKEKASRFVSP